ncbi:hypothetical protein EI94DRAFT_1751867 [Lactarius quietus]|nr:hypothetical protein EI94DRAFT_1751867 [Lactarius quietus]
MASTNKSRFSTLKIFNFTSSKPPPLPPKDAHYLYASSSRNPPRVLQQPLHLQPQQSPPQSIINSSRSLAPSPASSKKSFFRKVSSLRKRSASKSSRVTSVDDATDDESISLPWNVQHHIHIDEAFQGVPPEWSSTLADLGYSEAEIALIQKGRRNRSPIPEPTPSATTSRPPSPASTTIITPHWPSCTATTTAPPPPPITPALSPNSAAPAAPPPTPASGGAFGEVNSDKEDDSAQSDAQYAFLNPHHQPAPIQPVPVPALPTPVHVLQRSPSNSSPRSPISPPRTASSDREWRLRTQTPPRRQFRVASPQVASRGRSPRPVTPAKPTRPLPEINADTGSLRRPSVSETPPSDPPRAVEGSQPAMQSLGDPARDAKEEEVGKEHDDFPRPSVLSILPPRLSLRKDTLGDLSSWSASLFSSIPSSSDGSASSSDSSSNSTRISPPERRPSKPSVRDQDGEGENGEHEDEGHEHDYSFSASPLYHELMGMMQDRSAAANGIGSPASGSPASTNFQLDPVRPVSPDMYSDHRDSQLTIRLDPRRDSSRDSSASASTIVHATIVRGASIVRRARADVIPAPASAATTPRVHEHECAHVHSVLEDDEESDSSSDICDEEEDDFSGSPSGTLALTSGPSSQEGWDGGSKSPRLAHLRDRPCSSPLPSPLRASFPESGDDPDTSTESPYDTPPPSAPFVSARRPAIAITTTNLETEPPIASPRYPTWLAAIVLPLVEFIDDATDPRTIFTDLQEIAKGESGSVYAAHAVPAVAQQFQPMTPRSPARRVSQQECKDGGGEVDVAQVAIKRVLIPRGDTPPKIVELRRELELARSLRHANVLHMERLYVDVVEESLWIGMELMDRSLADVLGAVGEESVDGNGPVAVSEKMIARFVWDVLMALSYIRKRHIAHRDVRSDNLLLSRAGVLKLSDFSNAVCSPPGTPKHSDPVGVVYWQAPEMRTGLYDPLKVDVWSLGATTWELAHGDPPFSDVQDTRLITGHQLPPVREPETLSRSFHDFLHLCSQPVASRPDPDELLNAYFIRTACPRSEIVRLLGQCKAIDEEQLLRPTSDDDFDP